MDSKQRRQFLQSNEWKAFRLTKQIQQQTDEITRIEAVSWLESASLRLKH